MKRLGKVLVMFILAGVVIISSFVAGMIFQANFYTPAGANTSTTALSRPGAIAPGNQAVSIPANAPPEFATFWEAWSLINDQFYGEIPASTEQVYGATRGMVAAFGDEHTAFIDPTRAAIMSENINGSFEGIGASVRLDEAGRLLVADAFPDQPAFKAGLRPGDVILAVDGQSTEGLNLFESVLLIRGPAGSQVVLTVWREDRMEPFEVPVIRAKIELEVVESKMLDVPGHIGYIRLTQFSKGAADKLSEALETLFDQGAATIVFDLRSNPGGLLSEAVAVSSLFLEDGTIVIEKLKGGEEKAFEARRGGNIVTDAPLVVLVNGGSASASEIVAGAIQDYKRGALIGQPTFGKGSVQLPHRLSDGSELRVTVAEWLTPTRRQIQGEGIRPDLVVEMTPEDLEQGLDPQLDEAVRFLSERVDNSK